MVKNFSMNSQHTRGYYISKLAINVKIIIKLYCTTMLCNKCRLLPVSHLKRDILCFALFVVDPHEMLRLRAAKFAICVTQIVSIIISV